MDLFRCRAKRVSEDELCAVDSTLISTYGLNLVDIRWGKNKEHLPLRQTLEVMVYSLTLHMPIYYKELPGNMPDCRTIELIMKELEHAGIKILVLITDRGYESMKNPELYISKGQKVITSVKASGGDVLEKIKAIRSCTCRDAHNTLHRANRKDEGHHPVRRLSGRYLQAFGFAITDGCAPVYVSKAKSAARKRGRPAKPKVEIQEF